MKRVGYIYDRMADWNLIKYAESVAVKNKTTKRYVQKHISNRIRNLAEIQQSVLNHTLRTDEYKMMKRISGQNKLRDIAKLNFHPSHIQHQLLVLAGYGQIDKRFIRHTYASRIGYGQHKGALQLNKWIQNSHHKYPWYVQMDIIKYYDNIQHSLIRDVLGRIFKDELYIRSFIEPFERYSKTGKSIPLGARPSQTAGNIALSPFDRYVKEELRRRYYLRYLDDFIVLCKTKADAKIVAKRCEKFLNQIGFRIHPPRIDKLRNGVDMLGYVCYPYAGMFLRTSTKKAWLKRRSKVTNRRRLREIDAAAWGYVTHGNKYCKRLYRKMNGVKFSSMGISVPVNTDKNGITSIDTVFVDRGGKHYDIDVDKTSVISINNREICLDEKGNTIYKDNNEQVNI